MKKVCRKLKLRKLKTELEEAGIEPYIQDSYFMVIFSDGKAERVYSKYDLENILVKDHIRRVDCVFDMNDKISIDRDVIIDTDSI